MNIILGVLTIIAGTLIAVQLWQDDHKASALWVIFMSVSLGLRQLFQ